MAYVVLIVVNVPVAFLFDVDMAAWARSAFVASAMPLAAAGAWLLPRQRVQRIVAMVVVLCAGITLYYLTLFQAGQSLLEIRSAYKEGFFQAGGTYSAAIITTLAFPFVLARGRWRVVFLALFALGLAGVAATFARTFWVTTPAALLITAATLRGRRIGSRAVFGLVTVVIVVSLLIQGSGAGRQYAGLVRERITQRDFSGSFRAEEAQGLLRSMLDQPATLLLGAGLGNTFSFHSSDPYAIDGVGVTTRDYSHNWYLEVLWSTGIPGLVVILLFIGALFRMLIRAARRPGEGTEGDQWDRLLCAGLLGTFTNVMLAAMTYQPFGILLWNLVLGLLAGSACVLAAEAGRGSRSTVAARIA